MKPVGPRCSVGFEVHAWCENLRCCMARMTQLVSADDFFISLPRP